MVAPKPRTTNGGWEGLVFPSVEDRVAESTEVWANDLDVLFRGAKERFGDVVWECEDGGERIWGHKAVIYARAPKAFKDRYFISKPFSRSPGPSSLRSPSPSSGPSSSHLLPPVFPSRSVTPPSSFHQPSPRLGAGSSLSVTSAVSDTTIRGSNGESGGSVLRLAHGDTPELFRAQLEWLYTGEGFGDVVEWISAEDSSTVDGGSIRDSLGRRGNRADRRDKLGQDLTYMWRSKLYADVRIHLDGALPAEEEVKSEGSQGSEDEWESTAIFTSHRFILASRSPYFASVLLNPSAFRPHTADIHLPTPPFSPAALHFCLGYIYAGHLDFSNRTFDLGTAFDIHRAAAYLQLDTLIREIEARVVHDFCHGLDWDACHCRKCPLRAARVWKFAIAPDIGAMELAKRARRFVVRAWGDCWGKDIGSMEKKDREALVRDVMATIDHRRVLHSFRGVQSVRKRMEQGVRNRGKDAAEWADALEEMVDAVEQHARTVLVDDFTKIAEGKELWDVVHGKGFSGDLLEMVVKELVDAVGTARACVEAPKIYQSIVSSILLKVDPTTLQTVLSPHSAARQQVETAKEGVLAHIRRRWMQIRDSGGFLGLEHWALKEISYEIDVSFDDLVELSVSPPKAQRRVPAITQRSSIPRTTSRIASLSEASTTSARGTVFSMRGVAPRTVSAGAGAPPPTEANGLRRLRLSSSASTSSVASTRSISRPSIPGPSENGRSVSSPLAGPTARSPTAARTSTTVPVGNRARAGGVSPTPAPARVARPAMSGPPRPLISRGGQAQARAGPSTTSASTTSNSNAAVSASSASSAPAPRPPSPSRSIRSIRSTQTTTSITTLPRTRTTPSTAPPIPSTSANRARKVPATTTTPPNAVAGPSRATLKPVPPKSTPPNGVNGDVDRNRRPSGATISSVRSRVTALNKAASATPTPPKVPVSQKAPSRVDPSSTRMRTASASTAASTLSTETKASIASRTTVRSTAPSIASTSRSVAPSVASTARVTPPTPKAASKVPTPRTARPTTTSSPSKRPAPSSAASSPTKSIKPSSSAPSKARPIPGARPTPPSAMPSLLSPMRSASSSTDETHLQTPQTVDLDVTSPLPSPPFQSKLPPVSMPRTIRKTSASSTRSATSTIRHHPAAAFDPPPRPSTPPALTVQEIADGSVPFEGWGVPLHVGIPCIVLLEKKRARFRAQVRYIGHMEGADGVWVGIESEDLEDRFDIPTLPSGSVDGIHYFHVSPPEDLPDLDGRGARSRHIDRIRESLGPKAKSKLMGLGLGLPTPPGSRGIVNGLLGVTIPSDRGAKRSMSPFVGEWLPFERPRALFVRPSEVLFVMGAE